MAISLRVGEDEWPIGTADFFAAFFSTICVRLEDGRWGSRFPTLMGPLYQGQLSGAELPAARRELATVRAQLRPFPPSAVVWDAADPSRRPPWGDAISEEITDLSNYFVTADGADLIDTVAAALLAAERAGEPVTIA